MIFEVGHCALGQRHPDPIDDPVQLHPVMAGVQDEANMGKRELVGRFVLDDHDRHEALDRRVDSN